MSATNSASKRGIAPLQELVTTIFTHCRVLDDEWKMMLEENPSNVGVEGNDVLWTGVESADYIGWYVEFRRHASNPL